MSAQERLGVRFAESDVVRRDDGGKTMPQPALRQNVADLLFARSRRDCNGVSAGSGSHSGRCRLEQNRFRLNCLKVIDTLTPDQVVESRNRQRNTVLLEQKFETIPIVQWEVFIEVLLIAK